MNKTPNQAMASIALAKLQAAIEAHGDFALPVVEHDGEEMLDIFQASKVIDQRNFEIVLRPIQYAFDRQLTAEEVKAARANHHIAAPIHVNPPYPEQSK